MIKIGITKKMKDKYDLEYNESEEKIDNSIFSWHANIFKISRKTAIIFINDETKYNVILFDVKKSDMKNLLVLFKNQLEILLKMHISSQSIIDNYLDQINFINFSKTSNTSILGKMHNNIQSFLFYIENYPILTEELLLKKNFQLNENLLKILKKYVYSSIEAMEAKLKELK